MQHELPLDEISRELGGTVAAGVAAAVNGCVHCGFCLPACPTYDLLGEEMDSPRGRIVLMKESFEKRLAPEEALPHVDACLGCMACVSACPSGVEYGDLLHPFRTWSEARRRRSRLERLRRAMTIEVLTVPWRLRWVARLGRLARPFLSLSSRLLPATLFAPLDLLPARVPRRIRLPERSPGRQVAAASTGKSPAPPEQGHPAEKCLASDLVAREGELRPESVDRVALLAGCAQQVFAPSIGRASIDVLAHAGVEVLVPPKQGCCGSLALHAGDHKRARRASGRALLALDLDVDAVLTNAAGCGSGLRDAVALHDGSDLHEAGQRVRSKLMDVSRFLSLRPFDAGPGFPRPVRAVYQDACHLLHAQRVGEAPRRLLRSVPNLSLIEGATDRCCGSAGTYNLEWPELAGELGQAKAREILALEPDVVITGNVGCMMQLRAHLTRLGSNVSVVHTMEALKSSIDGTMPA